MAFLCCTSDFAGDGLGVANYRLYFLWDAFVDKDQTEEEQIDELQALYDVIYPNDPPVTVVALPVLDCADYDGDLSLGVSDYRLYFLWDAFVDHEQPEPDQIASMTAFYSAVYPDDPAVSAVRIPAELDINNCDALHGWFQTPWHETVEIGAQTFGWFS
jgi:hypothetical protein